MHDFPFAIVGFDLDGTLVDSVGDIAAALNHALALAGRAPLDVEAVRPMIGLGTAHLLEQGLAATGDVPADTEHLYRALIAYYETHVAERTRLFPGAVEALDRLAALGAKTAVVTNKLEHLARELLETLGIADRLTTIVGGDTLGPGKAKPSSEPVHAMIAACGGGRTAFVGDSIYDVMAARGAGAASIAVDFGHLHHPVEDLGADHVIRDYTELVPLLAGL